MYLYRIITFMAHPELPTNPRQILLGGSRTITYTHKHRVFTVRKTFYDDDMTPLYTHPEREEVRYGSLQELRKALPHHIIWDSPILDKDNYLKIYNNEKAVK